MCEPIPDFVRPAADGSVNVRQVLDFHLQHKNLTPIFSWAAEDESLTHVSHVEFARAAHRVAHLLRPAGGEADDGLDRAVVGILALADPLVYTTVIAGCIIAGMTELPTLAQMYPLLGRETLEDPFIVYPRSGKVLLEDVAIYLHSSGSTGFPKPIPMSHRTCVSIAAQDAIVQLRTCAPRMSLGLLPSFHAMGFFTQFLAPLYSGVVACIHPPAALTTPTEYRVPAAPTPGAVMLETKRSKANGIFVVPIFLVRWAQNPEDVAHLASMSFVSYSGGPLAESVGDFLVSKGVPLLSLYGGTEFGAANVYPPLPTKDWSWIEFSPSLKTRWLPVGDNTVARFDDVLTLSNGEKHVPGAMEQLVSTSPLVSGALMFGRGREQLGILVEPTAANAIDPGDEVQLAQFRNQLWSVVEEANGLAPAFARLYKEMILVTRKEKPMSRAPKGTVIRGATLKEYELEINALYETLGTSHGHATGAGSDIAPPTSWSAASLEPWLLAHASSLQLSSTKINPATDLFQQGFDSLGATFLRHRIVGALRAGKLQTAVAKISQNFVYEKSSILGLARALEVLVAGYDADTDGDTSRKHAIEEMIKVYSAGLDAELTPKGTSTSVDGAVVMLTGSTGGLGSHILDLLLRDDKIAKVYAFNRPNTKPMMDRQKTTFQDRGLDVEALASSKVIFLEGDSTQSDLGLSDEVLVELKENLTMIVHNAWTLDFNRTLASFSPHIQSTRTLVDLARSTQHMTRILLTSSIASVHGWDPSRGPVPEEPMLDAQVAVGTGYGEGKYVAERILAASKIPFTTLRIGQLTGSHSTGTWSTSDWVPALVKSSITLGAFPSYPNGTISWLPPDAVAQAIVDLATLCGTESEKIPTVLNLVHPQPVGWDLAFGAMAELAGLPSVPIAEWVGKIESASVDDIENIPAIKLLDFLQSAINGSGDVQFATDLAQKASPAMKALAQKPLALEDAKKWMDYWKGIGFI
ncbi:PKS-PP domain-containing protein [Mycena chlorophos]|uniref:PKS-PP domain-containing protein n=1 Tax=Mycena chlorophos TaxID=658473 RepID=A0A8H6SWE4_MYCCL|nr:PKS-PP domain-containing protein [Mycena chlorophos]